MFGALYGDDFARNIEMKNNTWYATIGVFIRVEYVKY